MSDNALLSALCIQCRHPHRLHDADGCRRCPCEHESFQTSTTKLTAHRLAMIEVAERGLNRRTITTGIAYARSNEPEAKRLARRRLLRLWNRNVWPRGLSIVTMPGLNWKFEQALLQSRENASTMGGERPPSGRRTDFIHSNTRRTHIDAIEREPTVFLGAIMAMPGRRWGIAEMEPAPFASRSVKTPFIKRFHLAQIERVLLTAEHPYDAMWLDFNGPLTDARIEGIRRAWGVGLVRTHLAVTLLAARQTVGYDAGRAVDLLRSICPKSEVIDAFHYQSGRSPMSQLVLGRAS